MNIKKITKKDGTIKYRTNVYLGIDSLTGKKVQTTATATTRKMCEIKANQAISNFIKNGSTVAREKIAFDDFKALGQVLSRLQEGNICILGGSSTEQFAKEKGITSRKA